MNWSFLEGVVTIVLPTVQLLGIRNPSIALILIASFFLLCQQASHQAFDIVICGQLHVKGPPLTMK